MLENIKFVLKCFLIKVMLLLGLINTSIADDWFQVVQNTDEKFSMFDRKVVVFGIPIYAFKNVEEKKLRHAANVMAQYLDNNEDGKPDHQKVVDTMIELNAFLFMWQSQLDFFFLSTLPEDAQGQDLGNDETRLEWHARNQKGDFDATLEEVWHLISSVGYANVYPEIFGETENTVLTRAMDQARAGHFQKVPNRYPKNAWYTYDDETCDYECMATEYFYWAMTSLLGAQKNRADEIQHEWRLHTHDLVEKHDPVIYQLLTDPQYQLPTKLPNGRYSIKN